MRKIVKNCGVILTIVVLIIGSFEIIQYFWVATLADCVINGSTSDVELMLKRNKVFDIDIAASSGILVLLPDFTNATALQMACFYDEYEKAELLLRYGADPNKYPGNSCSPLCESLVEYNEDDYEMVKLLLDYDANPDVGGLYGSGALSSCAMMLPFSCTETDEYIVYNDYDGKIASAITEIYKLIEGHCVNKNPIDPGNGFSMLQRASYSCNKDLVRYLIDGGCDINRTDEEGSTALFLEYVENEVAANTFVEVAEFLIKSGIDIDIKNNDGLTAAQYARKAGYSDLAEVIESYAK